MAGIPDRAYNAACARLASAMGVSLAAARRKVEVKATAAGIRDTAGRQALAEELLAEATSSSDANHAMLSSLLEAVGSDEHFMLED
ncbi:hypothetical protein CPCC7001_1899 [Cyanobium sp. PCC 7001]|uniref:hypothetical protein n=1 Tax=Cyanobium sp. PCC 7001 TaxID=180281 RepID=UPI0001805578|nr:hypothetical protein [Cyanobium sp. PCC 7001]EDY39020.1 hypothetical protein CPCC7001_1899 [Cyanobium sp. PCC 7001]